jgi:CHAT domain-containing protein
LPSVKKELRDLKNIINSRHVFLNEDYTVKKISDEIKNNDYSVVHLATHGVFGGTARDSFLLTYDDRLNMNQLENILSPARHKNKPIDLLTLSACQTALGNERASLGLAGIAVKAGVKTAIATLWYVDDEATSLVIKEFYRQLTNPDISKVEALQKAQKSLISQKKYWHPIYWGPFLLIGSWG